MKFVILGFIFCPVISFSQTLQNNDYFPLNKSFFSVAILPNIINKGKIKPVTGNYRFTPIHAYGLEAGVDDHINLKKNYSIDVGFHVGVGGRNFTLYISKNDFDPTLAGDVNEDGQLTTQYAYYASIPLWLEKYWFKQNKNFWNFVAGVNIRIYPVRYSRAGIGFSYPDVNGQNVDVFEIESVIGNNYRPWLNYNMGGGYALMLHNHNYLQCNLVANLSNTKFINGTYTITVTGKPQSTGNYSANLSYIGLNFSYIFTGANKRMRKIYEHNLR